MVVGGGRMAWISSIRCLLPCPLPTTHAISALEINYTNVLSLSPLHRWAHLITYWDDVG